MPVVAGYVFQTIAGDVSSAAIPVPVETQTGDVLLVLSASDNNPDGHIVRGNNAGQYAVIASASNNRPSYVMAYAVQPATPDTQVTVDLIQARGGDERVIIAALRGIDTAAPIAVAGATASAGSGPPDPPPLTTSGNAIRVIAGFLDDDEITATPPAGFGETITTTAGSVSLMMALQETGAGTVDPGSFGGSGDDEWHAVHLAFTPAVTASPPAPPTGLSAIIL